MKPILHHPRKPEEQDGYKHITNIGYMLLVEGHGENDELSEEDTQRSLDRIEECCGDGTVVFAVAVVGSAFGLLEFLFALLEEDRDVGFRGGRGRRCLG
jgi:hypothetical protein